VIDASTTAGALALVGLISLLEDEAAKADGRADERAASDAAEIRAGVSALKLLQDSLEAGAALQHTDDWKRVRKRLITASLAHRALGEARRRVRGPLARSYARLEAELNTYSNDAMREGQDNEPLALRQYALAFGGWVVVGAPCVTFPGSTPSLPCGGSVDGLWVGLDFKTRVLEAKTVTTHKPMFEDGPPPDHSTQMQMLMLTYGLERAVYSQSRSRLGISYADISSSGDIHKSTKAGGGGPPSRRTGRVLVESAALVCLRGSCRLTT
jgi:hypothetical protein